MHDDPPISRRRALIGLGGAAVAIGLAACGTDATTVTPPTSGRPTRTTTPPSGSPSRSPSPSPTVTAEPTADVDVLRRKAARMVLVGFRGLRIRPDDAITVALEGGLGGVILFDRDQTTGKPRNIASPEQLAALTASLRTAASGPLLIAVDQEGGRISRLNPAQGFPKTRSQAAIGATDDPAAAGRSGRAMGATMAGAGIDLDLAPVVDVDIDPANPAIGALDRSFSADPAVVAAMAEAEIRGLHEHGIRSAIKHFPGLGSASANTDFASVDVTDTWTDAELSPYETLIGLGLPDAIMSAHIIDRKLDPKLPASLSPRVVTGLLRTKLGWNGCVITDDLGAVAIASHHKRTEAIALAIEAGNDLLTFANQASYVDDLAAQVIETIVGLVRSGRIGEARLDESIERLDRLDRLVAGPVAG